MNYKTTKIATTKTTPKQTNKQQQNNKIYHDPRKETAIVLKKQLSCLWNIYIVIGEN